MLNLGASMIVHVGQPGCVWAGSQNETVIDGSMVKAELLAFLLTFQASRSEIPLAVEAQYEAFSLQEGIAPTAPALPENAFVVQLQKGTPTVIDEFGLRKRLHPQLCKPIAKTWSGVCFCLLSL